MVETETLHLGRNPGGAPSLAATPLPVDGRTVGRFRVERELARGGMGVVLLAQDRDLGRLVAVKLLKEGDPETVARFRLEANSLAGLTHPHAVRVFEFGEHEGRPFLAMEYVPGPTLHDLLRTGPLDPWRAADLLGKVAGAVQAAHELGVAHRDLKPANVLLSADDSPKLTDFGIARRLDGPAGLTGIDVALGTPEYMAPEQAAGKAPDPRTDVYGLGATLYECLTGRPPFVGPPTSVLVQVNSADPVPPRRLNAGVPVDLETVCLKCLEKDPAKRYPTAAAVAADLQRVVRREPVLARPTGRVERAVRWGRRNKPVAALSAATVLAVVGGAAAAGWQAVAATRALDAEAAQRLRAEDSAAEVEAVNRFLLDDLLRQASSGRQVESGHAPDPNLTVREAVRRAAAAIGDRFPDRPATAASLRMALGDAFRGLGDYAAAADQHQLCWEWRRGQLGPDHPDTLTAYARYAVALVLSGKPDDARAVVEDCLARQRAVLGPDDPRTNVMADTLADLHLRAGRPAEAAALAEDAHRRLAAAAGATDGRTLNALGCLAKATVELGQVDRAVAWFDELIQAYRQTLGPKHPYTVSAIGFRAAALSTRSYLVGRPDRAATALAGLEECAALAAEVFGPDHPEALVTAANMVQVYEAVGRPADTIRAGEPLLARLQAGLGPDNPTTLILANNLALAMLSTGRLAEAHRRFEEVVPTLRRVFGPDHPAPLMSLHNLGYCRMRVGDAAGAVAALDESRRRRAAAVGADHPEAMNTAFILGLALLEAGRPADALPVFEDVWRWRLARTPPVVTAANAELYVGRCLMLLGRAGEAEPRLLAAEPVIARPGFPFPQNAALARRWLAEVYCMLGRADDAARWEQAATAPGP